MRNELFPVTRLVGIVFECVVLLVVNNNCVVSTTEPVVYSLSLSLSLCMSSKIYDVILFKK